MRLPIIRAEPWKPSPAAPPCPTTPCAGRARAPGLPRHLCAQGIRPALAREALERGSQESFEVLIADAGESVLVAERAGHLVGFAHLRHAAPHEQLTDPAAAELCRLYVQEPFTGRGVGRALLLEAERAAAVRGASTLWLTAWDGNARALAFYPRQGYAHAGDTLYTFEGESYGNVLFARRLGEGG